jgi:2-iminoacetate synthase ThiH
LGKALPEMEKIRKIIREEKESEEKWTLIWHVKHRAYALTSGGMMYQSKEFWDARLTLVIKIREIGNVSHKVQLEISKHLAAIEGHADKIIWWSGTS